MATSIKPSKDSTEVATTNTVVETAQFDPNTFDWDTDAGNSLIVNGSDLLKNDTLDALTGVPFLIHRVTIRPGIGDGSRDGSYVSCECIVAPEHVMRKRRVNMENLPFEPSSQIVFNDSSTGIRRQIVAALVSAGYVTLPGNPDISEAAKRGDSALDLPPAEWDTINAGTISFDEHGAGTYRADIRIQAPRGIRVSEYDGPVGRATTRYLG